MANCELALREKPALSDPGATVHVGAQTVGPLQRFDRTFYVPEFKTYVTDVIVQCRGSVATWLPFVLGFSYCLFGVAQVSQCIDSIACLSRGMRLLPYEEGPHAVSRTRVSGCGGVGKTERLYSVPQIHGLNAHGAQCAAVRGVILCRSGKLQRPQVILLGDPMHAFVNGHVPREVAQMGCG